MRCIFTNILTPLSSEKYNFLPDHWLWIDSGRIKKISPHKPNEEYENKSDCLCLPGMIDAHVHLSQLYIRGKYAPDLLTWLHKYTFAAERLSQDKAYAIRIARDFYQSCLKKGTTTSVVYTSPYMEACQAAFEVAEELQVRSIIGMTMMDTNSPDYLSQSTEFALSASQLLWEKWHDSNLLDYIYSPRFAVTSSRELLQETGKIIHSTKARLQSHLSENKAEISRVLQLFPECRSYTEIYDKYGILSKRTILGHAIHLNSNEISRLQKTDTRIAYCPDSNLFLKSGRFNWQNISDSGIKIGLASDVGAGTDLSMLKIMKFADYVLDKPWLNPQKAFYHATLGNAVLLGLEDKIGSVETGKEADLVFVKKPEDLNSSDELLSWLVYLNHEVEILSTFTHGKELYKKDKSGGNDEIS